ncbi:MAG TPA: Xaa-Pro peptidase family protein [Planctomycetota bacterium]|nr:Xaa-Pro peptidase family protein [Planctomycetota bacterium]
MKKANLIYAASETDANLFYATNFLVGDPVAYVEAGKKKMLVLNDLEIGRGRDEADVDEVLSLSELTRSIGKGCTMAQVIEKVLRTNGVTACTVPGNFPLDLADQIRARKIKVECKVGPFYPQRLIKTPREIRMIEAAQRATEDAVHAALDLLRHSKIRGHKIYHRGEVVTSELLKRVINVSLMERNCIAKNTIVASGDQGCDPHNRGTGPVKPDQTLILDVFPRSGDSHYFADQTRTVVKGKATPAVKRLYAAVLEAQEVGIAAVRHGVNGRSVHEDVKKVFDRLGYKTEPRNGKMVGFFHGTGHGVGLDIHEQPSVGSRDSILETNAVVTVEPGLYYFGVGGVRIEDMVLVTRNGCRNLTKFPKALEDLEL